MFALIFEYGMVTLSWYAWLALRRRVSMSAIGSVMVMCSSNPSRRGSEPAYGEAMVLAWAAFAVGPRRPAGQVGYQEAFETPGSSPRWAMSRMQMRHSPNLR